MYKKAGITAGLIGLAAAGAALAHDDEGEKISRTLNLAGFDSIKVSGVYEIDVRVGSEFSIQLSGYEDEMERVEATVKNGELNLGHKKRGWRNRGDNNDHGVEAVITMPAMQ